MTHTWAPRGETPLLVAPLTRDHISIIGALSLSGELYTWEQAESFDSEGRVPLGRRFLEHLLEEIEGNLMVFVDGATIHRSQAMRDFLAKGAGGRLQLVRLPAYAPELNPIELIWRYLKQTELANLCCKNMAHLWEELMAALDRIRGKAHVLQSCFAHVGYIN